MASGGGNVEWISLMVGLLQALFILTPFPQFEKQEQRADALATELNWSFWAPSGGYEPKGQVTMNTGWNWMRVLLSFSRPSVDINIIPANERHA